jgi:hypothetical protein
MIVKHNQRHRIESIATFLSRELAQTRPDTLTLSVISGSSFLAFTRLSDSAASAVIRLVRLFA